MKRQRDNNKLLKDRQEKMSKLSLDISEQEIAKQSAMDASKRAAAEAVIAESHKKAAEKSAAAAAGYKIKAKKEAETLIAKALLDKVKKELLNNKSKMNELINKERENKLKMLNEANYEKEVLSNMKKELERTNKRVYEIEKEIKDKQGENMILTYKQRIAAANKITGGVDSNKSSNNNNKKNIECDMIKTKTDFNGDIIDDSFIFNGKDSFIMIPPNLSPQLSNSDFTIEFWCKVNLVTEGFTTIYQQGIDKDHENLAILIDSKFIYLDFSNGQANFDINNIDLKKWNHYAIIYDKTGFNNKGSAMCYVNGNKLNVNYLNDGPGMRGQTTASGSAIIGKGKFQNNINFNGELKKLKIYNTKLSDIDIKKSSKYANSEYCPKNVLNYIPMNKKDNFIYTRDDKITRKKNDIIIDEIYMKLEYAVKEQRNALDKWNNRKKILVEKLKKYREDVQKNKANINLTREKFEFKLNEQLKAEKELLKRQTELDNAERQNKILKDEVEKAEAEAEKRIEINKLKDRLRELDKNQRVMQEKEVQLLKEQALRLKQIENENNEKLRLLEFKRNKKLAELKEINLNIKDKGYVSNVNVYPIASSLNKPYKELYSRYPILQSNNILVLDTIDTAINVLNNFDIVEIGGHVGKISWIKKNKDNNNLNYCMKDNIKENNLIDEGAINYVCPASYEKKNKCYSCDDIKLDEGIIVITNLMPKLDKPLLNKTLRKLDSGIVNSIVKYTPLELDNKGDTRVIERLNIDCGEFLLNQFKLLRGYENNYETQFNKRELIDNNFEDKADQIGYQYTCNKINKKGEIISKKTELNDDGTGKNYFLDRHKVNCQTGLITSFNLKTDTVKEKLFGKNFGMYYDYKCFLTGTKNCTNHYTMFETRGEELNNDIGDVKHLSKHNIKCPEHKFLKDFKLETNDTEQIRYKYKCCEIAKEGEISTGDIPDNFIKENIIFNGTSNEHSFLFNGLNNYFTIPVEHSPNFTDKPFTIEFNFKIIKNKFSFLFSQGKLSTDPKECCKFFGIAIRSSAKKTKDKKIIETTNNKIYLTLGYKAWETIDEFITDTNYHFAITYDINKTIRMFVNGLPIRFTFKNDWRNMLESGKSFLQYTWSEGIKATGPIFVGKLKNEIKENNYFKGELSNIRIWDIDRNENEIKNAINQTLFTKNLIIYLPLNKNMKFILINNKNYTGESELSKQSKLTESFDVVNKNEKLIYNFIQNDYKDIKKLYINKDINVYPNYKITFYLTIYEKAPYNSYTNILQISTTKADCCKRGDISPAFYISHNNTKLAVSTGSRSFSNNNYNNILDSEKNLIPDQEYFINFSRYKSNIKLEIWHVKSKEKIVNIERNHIKYQDDMLIGSINISNNSNIPTKGMIKDVKYYQTHTNEIVNDGREKQKEQILEELEYKKKLAQKYNDMNLSTKLNEQIIMQNKYNKLSKAIKMEKIKQNMEKDMIKIMLGRIDTQNPISIKCVSATGNNVKIIGSVYITKNNSEEEIIKHIPKNNVGPCASNNKCSGYKAYNYCTGENQDIGDGGCNKYCNEVGGGYYRSDLKGCVKNYCSYPSEEACSNGYFKKLCSEQCINTKKTKIGVLKLKPVWNNNYHSNLGYTNFEAISNKEGTLKGYVTSQGDIVLETLKTDLGKVTFNFLYKAQNKLPQELCYSTGINSIVLAEDKLNNISLKINEIKKNISSLKMKGGQFNSNDEYTDMCCVQSSKYRLKKN